MAHGTIRRNTECRVVRISSSIVIRRVTALTCIRGVHIIAMVTGRAIVGNGHVSARKGINAAVVKGSWRPGCFCMANDAICGELRLLVVGIGHLIVIISMTAKAGLRGIGIIAVVTGVAIVGNDGMRPV